MNYKVEIDINLNEIDKVKQFAKRIEDEDFTADLSSGHYVVDAKSLLGIFSLNLSKKVRLTIHTDKIKKCDDFIEWIKENGYTA